MWPFSRRQPATDPVDSTQHVLSFLTPSEITSLGGMPHEAVAAVLAPRAASGKYIHPASARTNPAFIQFMHHVIRTRGPLDPDLQAAAARQGEGWVYVIDLRTPEGPQGNVPPEDIIGGFEVVQGELVADTYWANEKHIVFTPNGLVRLPPSLREAFVDELKRLKEAGPEEGRTGAT